MFVDPKRAQLQDEVCRREVRLFSHLLTPDLFWQAARDCKLKIVRSPLNLVQLVWLSICAARHPEQTFADLLRLPLNALLDEEPSPTTTTDPDERRAGKPRRSARSQRSAKQRSRHDPHGQAQQPLSDAAFCKARRRLPSAFWVALLVLLGQRFQRLHAQQLRWLRFRLLAVDGTRLALSDYPPLRDHYGTANNATGPHGAQARLVLLTAPLARLPLAYALEPLSVGESTMARQLLLGLHPADLVLLDAGFLCYGLMQQIHRQGASFCLRLRKRLNLRVVKKLGSANDVLVEWRPKDSRGQWRQEGLPRVMTLRRLTYHQKGFRPLQLLTNVLDEQDVGYEAWWGLSVSEEGEVVGKGAYNWRWEIETTYWEIKVVQKLEGGLRSRTVEGVEYEVAGHIVHYLLVRWLMVEAAAAAGVSPLRLSFTEALREVGEMRPTARSVSTAWLEQVLRVRLWQRLASHRVEERPGRLYPRDRQKRRAKKRTSKSKRGRKRKRKQRRWFGNGWNLRGPIPNAADSPEG